MDIYINAFEGFCDKLAKPEEPLRKKIKQILFLNGIIDRDYDGIKHQRDNLSL